MATLPEPIVVHSRITEGKTREILSFSSPEHIDGYLQKMTEKDPAQKKHVIIPDWDFFGPTGRLDCTECHIDISQSQSPLFVINRLILYSA